MRIGVRTIVTLACAGAALAGVCGLVWLGPKRPPSARMLLSLPEDSISRLDIAGAGGQAVLQRERKRWEFVSPLRDVADSQRMRELVSSLGRLPVRESLQPGELKDSQLGLSPSKAIRVELGIGTGNGPVRKERIFFGRPGVFEGTVYARLPDRPEWPGVHLVETPVRPVLAAPVDQLRERRLFTFPAGAVRSYSVKRGSLDIELTREEEEPRWFLSRPIRCRANDDIAYSILAELAGLRAERFHDDRVTPAGSRIGEETALIVIQPEAGARVSLTLEPKAAKGTHPDAMLVHVAGRNTTLEIADDLVVRLPRHIDQLRFPYLVEFSRESVARILIESRDDPDVHLWSDGRKWNLMSGETGRPANEERVKALLGALLAEPVLEFRSNSLADLARYGLDRPAVRLSLVTSGIDADVYDAYQQALAKARLEGRETSSVPVPEVEVEQHVLAFSTGPDGVLNVNPVGSPFIYGIDPALLSSSLPTHPLKWRDLEVLSFSLFDVRSIGIAELGLPAVRLEYDYLRNGWAASVGGEKLDEGAEVDARRAELLASTLGNLRARDFLTSRGEAYQALSRPACTVTVRTAARPGDPETERVLLLAAAGEGARVDFYYGQFQGDPDVFIIDAAVYERMVAPVLRRAPPDSPAAGGSI